MGWLIALGAVLLFLWIPVGVSLLYGDDGFFLKIRLAFFRFSLPKGGGEKKEKKKKKKEPQEPPIKEPAAPKKTGKKKKKRPLSDYLPFLKLALDLLNSLRRKLRIEKLYGKITLAGEDPCDLAVNYGRAWAGVSALLASLNQALVIKDQNVNVQCDFTAEKTRVDARVDLTLTIGRILGLAVLYGIRALKEFVIFKNKKGGAENE